MIASRFRPSTVSNQSGVSYDASDAHTNMTTFSRPASWTKPRRSWAAAHDSYREFRLGHPNPTRHPGAGSPGRCEWALCAAWSQSYLGKKCSGKLGQGQTGQNRRRGRYLHTHNRRRRFLQGAAYWCAFKTNGAGCRFLQGAAYWCAFKTNGAG